MKTLHLKTFVLTLGLFIFTGTSAHDPSEHKAVAEAPKCEAMGDMDHSEMKSDDPVMQAMMEKCKTKHMDKNNDEGMMEHHADDTPTTSDHHDKMNDKMEDKGMMDHHADDDAQTESKSTEEHTDESHSDDHD